MRVFAGLSGSALAFASAWTVACGPSFQATYECEVHFEHCYALDDTVAAPGIKQQCWRDWLNGYTFGQPRDRVDYASARDRALSAPPGDAVRGSSSASALSPALAAPLPTSPFAPPPPTSSAQTASSSGDAGAAPQAPSGSRPPDADCTAACDRGWLTCHDGCREAACAQCDKSYRLCVPRCFR